MGAEEDEVVAMNSLTVNLHLMLVSFYRPTKKKYKILLEPNAFPSDRYAVDSQARFHGHDPSKAIVELQTPPDKLTVSTDSILDQIDKHGDALALILLGHGQYLSGQAFAIEAIAEKAREKNLVLGLNLAHGVGNLPLDLHKWGVDFAVWCSYKYLNAGPGGMAGAFAHGRHLSQPLPRFEGWWGHNKSTRLNMPSTFDPLPTVEAWQLSNPPIFQMAALRASLELLTKWGCPLSAKKAGV